MLPTANVWILYTITLQIIFFSMVLISLDTVVTIIFQPFIFLEERIYTKSSNTHTKNKYYEIKIQISFEKWNWKFIQI